MSVGRYGLITALLAYGAGITSVNAEGCATIYVRKGLVATVFTSPAQAVSIEFPKPYSHHNITNGDLWYIDDASTGTPDNVLIVSPKLPGLTAQGTAVVDYNGQQPLDGASMQLMEQALKMYKTSNLHVFAMDNTLYALTVKVADRHPACYTLVDTSLPTPAQRRAVNLDKTSTAMSAAQARDSIQQFIDNAYPHYTWTEPQGWYGSPIEKVIDDGRFTYIKVKDSAKGPMAVLAKVDDQLVVVQHSYDASKRTYRVHGVYPSLVFKHGGAEMTVTRDGT